MAKIKIISQPWGKYRPPLTDEEMRARYKKQAEEYAKEAAMLEQKVDKYKQKIENIFHFQRQDEIRRNVIKLLLPFNYSVDGMNDFFYEFTSDDNERFDFNTPNDRDIGNLFRYFKPNSLRMITLKKLGLGLDRFACDKLVYDSRLWDDEDKVLLIHSDDIISIKSGIKGLIESWKCHKAHYCNSSCDLSGALDEYNDWIKKMIDKDMRKIRNGVVKGWNAWGYDYYLKYANDDLDLMIESLKAYGDFAFDFFVLQLDRFWPNLFCRWPLSSYFSAIDPNVVFTLAKLKENGYKNLIEKNQEEADMFYRLSFLMLVAYRFRVPFNDMEYKYTLSDISPLYNVAYYKNCPDYLLFFNIEEFLEKYESFDMGDDFANRLFLAARNYRSKQLRLEKNEEFKVSCRDFIDSFDDWEIEKCLKHLNDDDFAKCATLSLEPEVICYFGFIFLQRKEYEKARECFGKAMGYEDFIWLERECDGYYGNEQVAILCNLAFVELAMGRVHHKFSKDGSHCQRLNFDSGNEDSSLNEAYARLDFMESYFKTPLPIRADFFFYANIVNEENYQYPRDVYICCYLNTMRGQHYPFECIGWSLFDHPNSSRENIAEICDIIHHKKTRDEQDEVFLRFFDGNHEETHKSKRKKYCSLRMKPLSSSPYKQINIHKKKERKNVYETN